MTPNFKKGLIHLGVLVLIVFSLLAVTAVTMSARHSTKKRPFTFVRKSPSPKPSVPPKQSPQTSPQAAGNLSTQRKPPCVWGELVPGTVLTHRYGDIDLDGYVTANDSLLVLQITSGKFNVRPGEEFLYERVDVDDTRFRTRSSKSDVTSKDAQLILQYNSALIDSFPVCGRI